MEIERRPLPYKVVDDINQAVLREYVKTSREVLSRIGSLLQSAHSVSDEELTLRNINKSIKEEMPTVYEPGEKVTINLNDVWVPATVLTVAGGLKIRREDGAVRMITDLTKVAKADTNTRTEGIWLEKFGVVIPVGTKAYEMEKALEPITLKMNATPLLVNVATWEKNLKEWTDKFTELLAKCAELSGNESFNPGSGKDCIAEFAGKRGLSLGRTGASGAPSVDKEVLQDLANQGDNLAPWVIKAREARSYLSQLESWAPFAKAGFVQANWNQYGQPHGRYTTDSPNLQNRVTPIRETIEPRPGFSFISADWGMAEYVVWASLSKDAYLSSIFNDRRDLHDEMGTLLKSANAYLPEDVPLRKAGKTINFALLYRMQTWTLAKTLGVTATEAENIQEVYKEKAPAAVQYIDSILEKAARDGYVETAFGRRLYCQDLAKMKGGTKHMLQKTVWHHHNAGTAAELLKLKMVDVNKALLDAGVYEGDFRVALNMHDEIIYEVRDSAVDEVSGVLYNEMCKQIPGFLPFKVDLRVGKTWLDISK